MKDAGEVKDQKGELRTQQESLLSRSEKSFTPAAEVGLAMEFCGDIYGTLLCWVFFASIESTAKLLEGNLELLLVSRTNSGEDRLSAEWRRAKPFQPTRQFCLSRLASKRPLESNGHPFTSLLPFNSLTSSCCGRV